MADTTFIDGETPIVAAWLNDVNDVVYNPSAAIIPASSIVNTPAGNIEATDVQTALNELDAEKQPLDATLTALAGTLTAANKITYATALNTTGELDWNSATALAASTTTISSNTVIKTAIDEVVANTTTATPDVAADYFLFEDATDGVQKKALLETIAVTARTSVAATSGTSIDFTSIPSWVKRITVLFDSVSTNGTADYFIQLGTGGTPTTTGYLSSSSFMSTGVSTEAYTSAFGIANPSGATTVFQGAVTLSRLSSSTNTWVASGILAESDVARTITAGGSVSIAGAVDIVRITTSNGTDEFDAGKVTIFYE